jgi:hypothetical protein
MLWLHKTTTNYVVCSIYIFGVCTPGGMGGYRIPMPVCYRRS